LSNPWISEAWRGGLIFLAALLIGFLVGYPQTLLLIAVSGYLAWHLVNLYRLERWYHRRKRFHPPEGRGIWGEVFHHIYQLQQRNRRRKRKLGTILSRFNESTGAMPDATVILTEDGGIEWFNKAATQYLGLRPKQDIGQRIDNLVRHPRFVTFLSQGDYEHSLEIPSPQENGGVLSIRIVPYGKKRRLMVARDVTRLKHLERVRQDFVANVSHELRTPLTVIAGYLENMADANDEFARRWGKSVGQMQEQTTRMIRLVEDLLLLSRLEAHEKAFSLDAVAVPALLASVKEEAQSLSGEVGHEIALQADQDLWLRGNEKILHSIFANLAFNAVQYSPDGGKITLRWFQDANGVCFEVEDSGIGIAPQHIQRLTERFYRVDAGRSRASGGTGLGLAIVKHGLDRHGGQLTIRSVPGKGSCFRCTFPANLALQHAA
jgi:two-component system phosphate regulon sensor histidine kinase PhoR